MGIQPVRQPPEPRVDKWERKGIRLELKAFFYYLAHLILKPISSSKSQYFKVKLHRTEHKIDAVRKKVLFKEHYVTAALNFPRTDVMKSKEHKKAALELWEKLENEKEKIEKKLGRVILFKEDASLDVAEDEGSCAGIGVVDVAKRRLVENASVEEIMTSLEKGASSQAMAAQAVDEKIYTKYTKEEIFPSLFKKLQTMQHVEETPEALKFDVKQFESFLYWKLSNGDSKVFWERDGIDQADRDKIENAVRIIILLNSEIEKGKKVGNDVYPSIDGNRIGEDAVLSDFFIHSLSIGTPSLYKAQVLGALNGLEVQTREDKLGIYLFHENDASYLKNLDRLDEGMYMIVFKTGKHLHTISLVREGEVDYIIDPNGVQLKSDSKEETRALLLKLLGEYPPPPSEKEGAINHRLEVYQFKASA